MPSLRSSLSYTPRELAFGTSGRRGLIRDLTDLEISINVTAELEYLQSLEAERGGIRRGDEFFLARDLRPSSERIARVVAQTVEQAGMKPVYLGALPTPALTWFALERRRGSIMITGSHIPFDRNGYKLNTSRGELLKEHESPIGAVVARVREGIYAGDAAEFEADGSLRSPAPELKVAPVDAAAAWIARYHDFFGGQALAGRRIVVYQHSAVGRDLLVALLQALGAEVEPVGRSEEFVPIDTENIGTAELDTIRRLASPAFAVVSTDGDSDRPLLLAPDAGVLRFFGGDVLGMVVAQYLKADAVVVPVSCNDAIDRGGLAAVLQPKTKIGSPWVIAGMEAAMAGGKLRVCGWEANGGFLLGSEVRRGDRRLSPLATRDAFLPLCATLCAAAESGRSVAELFEALPARFSRAGLLKNFPRALGLRIVEELNPALIRSLFHGFPAVESIDRTDGARVRFVSGDVAHIRPSGNADELRIYAVADTAERAEEIVAMGIREPDGLLRRLEAALA